MRSYIFMSIVVIIYAGNILTGKAMNDLPPFTIAFFRLLVAFAVLLPFGYRTAIKQRAIFWDHKKPFLFMTLTGITFFNTFIYGSLQFTTASNVSVLETFIPVVTVLLSAWLLKEKLRYIQWAGILLSFFGAIWVVMDGNVLSLATTNWNIGDAIMIGAIVCWAIYSILVKRYMTLFPQFGALLVMSGISVIILLPFVVIEWIVLGVPYLGTLDHIMGLMYLGIFPSFIALILYNRSVEDLGASQASIFLNFLPVVTIAGAYIWLGESMTIMQIVGALGVIAGVIMTTQFGGKASIQTEVGTQEKTV
ncbi:DMT family transporter [Salinibacillus xinjiangensis]|uniref:EamA family transporter n=1 Tax=Salinibacillus xinjiangensis TaxID=1229268 RepID=A0A6G1X4F3_9BACI|nr:DMT family transporter [Salinibacillus xinjiangensis]MRG85785.1 EamA family transporter [Salinibacillus xinjiangensis]